MTTEHNVAERQSERADFLKQSPHEHNVTPVTLHNRTYNRGGEGLTLRTESGSGVRLVPQKMVQPPSRGLQPFYPDVDRPPASLHLGFEQVGSRPGQVQRPAVPEVQACPPHGGSVA